MIFCTVEKKPVSARCNSTCGKKLGCYSTRWRGMETAPRDGTPIMAVATRKGWPGDGARCCIVWSYGRWVIYGASGNEPRQGQIDIQPLDEVQPSIWTHLPSRP